ncbi:uncharacterized protein LOC110856663 [Folsomia candida]|uniref:Uncharacterized protein n=1 Tax=Folsomia candida TaxID=158441 RepID=A0A226DK92_FOLCA|nr:uncharacterized protein LOC110856663 [Folsomia candida]OXA45609.1 hypothetical protein Fcan01_19533 [Folsomia candida]
MAHRIVTVFLLGLVADASAMTHAQAMTRLTAAGMSVTSSGGCSDRNNPTCTSFEGVRENTIAGLETLKRASACPINVTGGTETGHASGTYSHWNGYKADISLNACINSYVTNSFTYIGDRGDGAPMYQSAAGNIYAKEGNHWDILYY